MGSWRRGILWCLQSPAVRRRHHTDLIAVITGALQTVWGSSNRSMTMREHDTVQQSVTNQKDQRYYVGHYAGHSVAHYERDASP